jgi:hypothetical protein
MEDDTTHTLIRDEHVAAAAEDLQRQLMLPASSDTERDVLLIKRLDKPIGRTTNSQMHHRGEVHIRPHSPLYLSE